MSREEDDVSDAKCDHGVKAMGCAIHRPELIEQETDRLRARVSGLEKERDEARTLVAMAEQQLGKAGERINTLNKLLDKETHDSMVALRERDEARAERDRWRDQLEREMKSAATEREQLVARVAELERARDVAEQSRNLAKTRVVELEAQYATCFKERTEAEQKLLWQPRTIVTVQVPDDVRAHIDQIERDLATARSDKLIAETARKEAVTSREAAEAKIIELRGIVAALTAVTEGKK